MATPTAPASTSFPFGRRSTLPRPVKIFPGSISHSPPPSRNQMDTPVDTIPLKRLTLSGILRTFLTTIPTTVVERHP
jgi:hypothetical protein